MAIPLLDDQAKLTELDQAHTLESAHLLPEQIDDIWAQTQELSLSLGPITNIVLSAMGGSSLGGHVVQSVYHQELNVPLTIVNGYDLPNSVNEQSLVICVSYSGTTEETISTLKAAIDKHAQIVVMASGGDLIEIANTAHIPSLKINATHNPSDMPRMAIGYMVMGLMGILAKAKLLNVSSETINNLTAFLRERRPTLETNTSVNTAKQLAYELFDKIVFLASAEHLTGPLHVINNQINENAKQITVELKLPELNHHYMEALTFPRFVPNQGVFLFADSSLYQPRNRIRIGLTRQVVEKAGFTSSTITLISNDRLTQAFECIQLGMYTNLYLAFLNGLNPAPIPVVDYFKHELAKA